MFIHIDPHSGVPLYRQMMNQIKHAVSSGILKPGQKLPSVRELSQTTHISPITTVKAYEELEREEVIETRRGLGTFVADGVGTIKKQERRATLRRIIQDLLANAYHLDIDEDEIIQAMKDELKNWRKKGVQP